MNTQLKASLITRFFAFIIDLVVANLINVVLLTLGSMLNLQWLLSYSLSGTLIKIVIILVLINTLLESSKLQASIGKLVLNCKVQDENEKAIPLPKSLQRQIIGILSKSFFGIGYLYSFLSKDKHVLHDQITKSYVVIDKRKGHRWIGILTLILVLSIQFLMGSVMNSYNNDLRKKVKKIPKGTYQKYNQKNSSKNDAKGNVIVSLGKASNFITVTTELKNEFDSVIEGGALYVDFALKYSDDIYLLKPNTHRAFMHYYEILSSEEVWFPGEEKKFKLKLPRNSFYVYCENGKKDLPSTKYFAPEAVIFKLSMKVFNSNNLEEYKTIYSSDITTQWSETFLDKRLLNKN